MSKAVSIFGVICLSLLVSGPALAQGSQSDPMTFFVASVGSGEGADLGGLDGADALCQSLAAGVGAGDRAWRAYLSTQGPNAVNARDRIGTGPHGITLRVPSSVIASMSFTAWDIGLLS